MAKGKIDVKVKINVKIELDEMTEQELNQVARLKADANFAPYLSQTPLLSEFVENCIDALNLFRENEQGRDL